MYNLKMWNKLNNIIVNGYKDYANIDLINSLSSRRKFDELFGAFGEGRNFWKYNVMDFTGYTTRYEAAVKSEHLDDQSGTTSPLTGYDGLFYPDAAKEFLSLYRGGSGRDVDVDDSTTRFDIPDVFFLNPDEIESDKEVTELCGMSDFLKAIHSIYWQKGDSDVIFFSRSNGEKKVEYRFSGFYVRWYSHLNYAKAEYQTIAM